MKNILRSIAMITLFVVLSNGSLLALSGQPKEEFDAFIKSLREEKRIDRIGYLILMRLPVSKSSENRVISLAGKFFYCCDEGYLTYVNYVRYQKIQKENLKVKILDKKRLDDSTESWYLVWVNNEAEDAHLKSKFEPIFENENTRLIRVRQADEDHLISMGLTFSILDESLLPLRIPRDPGLPIKPVKVDPFIQGIIASVSKDILVQTVQTLQDCKSRYVREAGNASATQWLASEFKKIPGLEVATPTFSSNSGSLSNVVATKKGLKEPNSVFVVCGHMDSIVSGGDKTVCPGADDDGTGTAATLEIARQLARVKLPYTVIFACWNAEEIGLVGSKAYAKTMAGTAGMQIKAVFDMDMIADKDDNEVVAIGNTRSNWLIDVFKDAALAYTGLKTKPLYNSNVWQSDHSSFWNIGASAILTAEGYPEMSAYYHSVNDLVKNFDPNLMERVARANCAALLTLNPPILATVRK